MIWTHATTRATTMLSADPKLATVEFAQVERVCHTPLHLAAFPGEIELAKASRSTPARRWRRWRRITRARHWSGRCFSGQVEMVKFLLLSLQGRRGER